MARRRESSESPKKSRGRKSSNGYDGETRRRRTKKSDKITHGEKVKRARNAYSFFYSDKFDGMKQRHSDWAVKDIARALGEKWHTLSESQKEVYNELARKDKKRADRERNALKKKNYDGREPSEYIKWSSKRRGELMAEHPEWGFGDISKEIGKEWRRMNNGRGSDRIGDDEDDDM